MDGGGQFRRGGLPGAVVAGLELGDALGLDVEADHRAVFAKFDGQGQADVAQADDGQGGVGGAEVGEVHGGVGGGEVGEVQGGVGGAEVGEVQGGVGGGEVGEVHGCS